MIIPTFDRPAFLERALESLARQTWKDFEAVVVNDAGAGVEAVIDRFAGRVPITYVRHAVNRNRAAARNTGICVARGQYLAYLDDDDAYRPDHLETLVRALAAGTHKVAYSDAVWFWEERRGDRYEVIGTAIERSEPWSRDKLIVGNFIPVLSIMHDRTCLDEVGGFDEDLGTHEDWELFLRLSAKHEFLHVARVTAEVSMRRDGSSTTSSQWPDFQRTMRLIYDRYKDWVKDRPDLRAAQTAMVADNGGIEPQAKDTPVVVSSPTVVSEARALLDRGQPDAAARLLGSRLDLAKQDADIVLTLADVLVAQDQLAAASEALEHGAKMHPKNGGLALKQAQLFYAQDDLSRAEAAARRAVDLGDGRARPVLDGILMKRERAAALAPKQPAIRML